MFRFEQIVCLICGHRYFKAAYTLPKYEVYICNRCGKVKKKMKARTRND